MAISRRLTGFSGLRVDLPHLRSIESGVSSDFDSMLRGLVTGLNQPYIIRGFKIKMPSASIAASALQVELADSCVLHSSATESGTVLTVPSDAAVETLDAANSHVIGSFQSGVPNYIALDLRRVTDTATIDQTAGWSPSQKIEFQRTTPIGRLLEYRFVITTNGFGTNLPLYIVGVSSVGTVNYLTNSRTSLFRLGKGGANPDSQSTFNFGGLANTQAGANPRREWVNTNLSLPNSLSAAPGSSINAFDYGDFSIKSLKDWMDAVMTRFKEISNSPFWYVDSALNQTAPNVFDVWWDSIGSTMTSKGNMAYNVVLEGSRPISGAWQAKQMDADIQFGDSYVQGFTSGNEGTVQSFNESQLLVNSLTKGSFSYGEILLNRRKFRPNLNKFALFDYAQAPNRLATLSRIGDPSVGVFADITSWSYVNQAGTDLSYSTVTINSTLAHGFAVGDSILVNALVLSGLVTPPNGVLFIKEVTSATQFKATHPFVLAGTPTILPSPPSGIRLDTSERMPFMPKFSVTSWSYVGPAVTVVAAGHDLQAAVVLAGDTSNLSPNIINISSTASLKLNQAVTGTGIPAGAVITSILSASSVEISQPASATNAGVSLTFKDQIIISGLSSATNAPNGKFSVDSLGTGTDELLLTAALAPTGTASVVSGACVRPDVHFFRLSINGAYPDEFDVVDAQSVAVSEAALKFVVGPDTLPPLNSATGLYELDGVVAESTVLDPIRIATITNDGAGNLTIVTTVAHGLVTTPGPISFTIYGDPANSIYIRSYDGIGIQYVSPTSFVLQTTGITGFVSYTNPLNVHSTFIKFSDNPYPGPIQWDEDIYVKGIIGDRWFRIPQSATCETTSGDANVSPVANRFNVNGQTGTAYLKNGEVAYVILERNKSVSSGAIYSASGGAAVSGSTVPLDIDGGNLKSGDFVKWEDEDESKWIRIAGVLGTPIVTNSFSLESDLGQAPSLAQRPAKTGKLVYSKGSYSTILVKQHHLVDASADVYWLAVRRDNGSGISKAYLKALELQAGEIRAINDNQSANLLQYTGALTQGAINPNYEEAQTVGPWQLNQVLTIQSIDPDTRMVSFALSPDLTFAKGDKIVKTVYPNKYTWTISHTLSSRTVVMTESLTNLSVSDNVEYFRLNYAIANNDNLTLAHRKADREQSRVNTALTRPIYDESVLPVQINLSGSGTVRSGSFVYTGPQANPTGLAWVLHGNASVTETVEGAFITMPGGHASIGPSAILVNILIGDSVTGFADGSSLYQNSVITSRTVNNPANPAFTSPALVGGPSGSGIELVLPPNQRTQVLGSEYVVFPTHSKYNKADSPTLAGEDLLLVANGILQTSIIDYSETFEGPKAKIKLVSTFAGNTRLRFRQLAAFGSSLAAKANNVSLQVAYNGGQTITEVAGLPVQILASNPNVGETALALSGSLQIYGGVSQLGGIFGLSDQVFVIGNESNKPKESWSGLLAIKTHASHPGSGVKTFTAAQTVTGAGPTTITGSTITLADNTAYRIRIKATARRSDGTLGNSSFVMEGSFYRDSAGVATASGYPMTRINGAEGDGVDYAIAFALSGNDVVAAVYGTTGSTIQWALSIESQSVSLAS